MAALRTHLLPALQGLLMYSAEKVAELIRPHLECESIERAVAHTEHPEALKRRLHDILHGVSTEVQEHTADEIFVAFGHPEYLQLL